MSATIPRVSGGAKPGQNQRSVPVSNEVSLIVGGKIWSGWTAIRIGRGVERFPSDFELALTERYPREAGTLMVQPGATCQVMIGPDTVITGRIDRYNAGISPQGHEVRIHGRSLCRALVDCSAGITPELTWITQFNSSSIFDIATQLGQCLGIKVVSQTSDADQIAPPIFLNIGETPYEVLERLCRWAGILLFDDPLGRLVFANEGSRAMASGFVQGINIEAAQAEFTADQRYSDYVVLWMSTNAYSQVRKELPDGSTDGNSRFTLKDTSQPGQGFRPKIIISEQVDQSNTFAERRAINEMNRRNGHSRKLTITTDTWRDSANLLWEPNRLTTADIPLLKVSNETFVIGEVTYRMDESGTHCDLVLMPKGAFAPEPLNLLPINWQVAQELKRGGAQKPQGSTRGLTAQGDDYDPTVQGRGDR